MQFSSYQIISALDRLGIKRDGSQPSSKGWLRILCPNPTHNDHNFGSCSINLNSGFVKCYSCNYGSKGDAKSIIDIVKDNMHFDFKQAKQFIEEGLYASPSTHKVEEIKKEKKRVRKEFVTVPFDPSDYYYTSERLFTKEFCNTFNIKHAVSGWNKDYFTIPIIDTEQKIHEYEGRKLREYEVLKDLYGIEEDIYIHVDNLKSMFNTLCMSNKIRLHRKTFKIMMDMEEMNPQDERILYLLKPKTLYAPDSRCQETIWNIDNLKYDEPLYVVEGLGSVASIWSQVSKNTTAIFGVSITDNQIKLLNRFKTVIHIPDFDKAGYGSVQFLRYKLTNDYIICDTHYEDTDEQFITDIKAGKFISPEEYNTKYFFNFRK